MEKSNAIITFSLILMFLMALGSVSFQPINAQSTNNIFQGDISINPHGVINPYTASIQIKDDIYVVTSDINGTITINANGIILDGNGHTITVPSVFSSGITINDASNCVIANFTITGGQYGINVYGTQNVIADNSISSVNNGVYSLDEPTGAIILSGSSNNVSGNTIDNCLVGINFLGGIPNENCSYNLITANTLTDCSIAMLFYDSSNNTIYHNNFILNKNLVDDSGLGDYPQVISFNVWDNGFPSGGNFWSDYQSKHPHAQMIDDSGIGNVSYVINSQNKDNYPLLSPFDFNLYLFRTTKPEIQVLTAENRTFSSSNVTLSFTVDKATSWIGYSFDGQQNVTVTGNFTIANMTNGIHDIAIYANDTFGNMGVQTTNFNVELPKPAPANSPIAPQTLPIIAIVAIFAVMTVSLLIYRRHRKPVNRGAKN